MMCSPMGLECWAVITPVVAAKDTSYPEFHCVATLPKNQTLPTCTRCDKTHPRKKKNIRCDRTPKKHHNHPWRLTAGTFHHGRFGSDHFPFKAGWFVGEQAVNLPGCNHPTYLNKKLPAVNVPPKIAANRCVFLGCRGSAKTTLVSGTKPSWSAVCSKLPEDY